MDKKELLEGNIAVSMAAVNAGCQFFAGYPITPQTSITEYLAVELPKVGGAFVQAESEVAAINMIAGAAAGGLRVMTATSGPGLSLMAEGMSYMAVPACPLSSLMCSVPGPEEEICSHPRVIITTQPKH